MNCAILSVSGTMSIVLRHVSKTTVCASSFSCCEQEQKLQLGAELEYLRSLRQVSTDEITGQLKESRSLREDSRALERQDGHSLYHSLASMRGRLNGADSRFGVGSGYYGWRERDFIQRAIRDGVALNKREMVRDLQKVHSAPPVVASCSKPRPRRSTVFANAPAEGGAPSAGTPLCMQLAGTEDALLSTVRPNGHGNGSVRALCDPCLPPAGHHLPERRRLMNEDYTAALDRDVDSSRTAVVHRSCVMKYRGYGVHEALISDELVRYMESSPEFLESDADCQPVCKRRKPPAHSDTGKHVVSIRT
eukprot:RCo006637